LLLQTLGLGRLLLSLVPGGSLSLAVVLLLKTLRLGGFLLRLALGGGLSRALLLLQTLEWLEWRVPLPDTAPKFVADLWQNRRQNVTSPPPAEQIEIGERLYFCGQFCRSLSCLRRTAIRV
jgi:hypothetical protein